MLTRWFFRRGGAKPAERGRFTRLARLLRARPAAFDPLQNADRPDRAFEAVWRQGVKRRAMVVLAAVGLWVVGIEARLVYLQVLQHDALSAAAKRRQELTLNQAALRGDIVDRHGSLLAYSVAAESLVADPSKVENADATVKAVCDALGDCSDKDRADWMRRLTAVGRFAPLRGPHAISPAQMERVMALKLPGLARSPDTQRYYPNSELAAHVIGFVGSENQGQAGIELTYEKTVRGEAGLAFAQVDAKRQRLETRVERAPVPGATIELTIDETLQYIAERELRAGVVANKAAGGTVIVMDPHTGEIFALANYPTFNPNDIRPSTEDERRNRAVQDVYEPGSTFKIVTASAALEEGIVKPTDLIDTNPGYFTVPGRKPISDTHPHGVIPFEDVIVLSSNVGAIKVGLRTGAERLARYVTRFGFGQALAPDFPGESPGIWRPDNLGESGLASVSMGYQVSVTPLQMIMAASSVANGGLLMEPHVVGAVIRDGRREPVAPKVLRRTIQPETVATLTTMMEGVVARGTATDARMDTFTVAGKTGTASKLINGHYSTSDYHASFVGFVPSRDPAIAILVVIDTPKAGQYYGGTVAAPIFKRIADAGLRYLGVPPAGGPVPPVRLAASDATPSLSSPVRETVVIPTRAEGGTTLMPDVRGLGLRAAVRTLGSVGLHVRPSGAGVVVAQSPEPGEPVRPGASSVLGLAPANVDSGDSR